MRRVAPLSLSVLVLMVACTDDGSAEDTLMPTTFPPMTTETGDMTGDGDGDMTGDGDGDMTGDGDGDMTGDGDGDMTGDGDGDEPPPPECGNGIVESGEACDDGNDINDDECTNECQFPNCGDGVVQDGEECDVGNETMFCDGDCTYAMCGDGYHNMLSEECDDGNDMNNDACVGACLANVCGDGFLHEDVETCDDENEIDTDDCTNACLLPECGDGIIWEDNETCDDQNDVDTDACTNACQLAVCGDGILQEGVETCDDGNFEDNDECPGSCEPATCGDGFVYADVEECDDGNNDDDDGCDAQCSWENGGIFELTFVDSTQSDDIVNSAMTDLFNSIQNPQPTDYVYFAVLGNGVSNPGAWCATRGDWYRNEYLTQVNTSTASGNWDKWTSPDGVNWSNVINQGYTNFWGTPCDSTAGSWCSEWGINPNSLNLVISPQKTGYETYGDGWNSGTVTFTFRYAASRFAACGF